MFKRITASCLFVLAASASSADWEPENWPTFGYEQQLEGVYKQSWGAQEVFPVFQHEGQPIRLYIEGVGKLGDFHGILDLDCANASRSIWVSPDDNFYDDNEEFAYSETDKVPSEVINGIREMWCSPNH